MMKKMVVLVAILALATPVILTGCKKSNETSPAGTDTAKEAEGKAQMEKILGTEGDTE